MVVVIVVVVVVIVVVIVIVIVVIVIVVVLVVVVVVVVGCCGAWFGGPSSATRGQRAVSEPFRSRFEPSEALRKCICICAGLSNYVRAAHCMRRLAKRGSWDRDELWNHLRARS